jgi:hypothetical protein
MNMFVKITNTLVNMTITSSHLGDDVADYKPIFVILIEVKFSVEYKVLTCVCKLVVERLFVHIADSPTQAIAKSHCLLPLGSRNQSGSFMSPLN